MAGTYEAQVAFSTPLNASLASREIEADYEALRVVDAVSPTVDAERVEGGVQLTIHDLHGTETVMIYDGEVGETGNGIASVALNADYTLTVTYTNGDSVTTPSIRGETGATGQTGATGNGIASVTLNPDYTLTITYTNGDSTTTSSIRGAQGEPGADGSDGQDGADGYSPTVAVSAITGGHRVTVTDVNGDHAFDIFDGIDGQNGHDGSDGQDGADGYSPTVAITTITGGHRVTVTDTNGDHVFDILDGIDGQDGAPGQDGQDGADGYSPTVVITTITGGHRVTITDSNGDHSFDILDGTDGQDGSDGSDGSDGYSPTVAISTITGGHRVVITDATGDHTFDISDGVDGQNGTNGTDGNDGYSPTVTITTITGGHRVTITDATGDHTFDISDGQDYVLTQQDKSDIAGLVTVPVTDVQVNGTTVVSNGVGNVPVATRDAVGVVRIGAGFIMGTGATNLEEINILRATNNKVKAGSEVYNPIVPGNQHQAVFYGLSKVAGVDLASETVTLGTYPDASKTAIKTMLGVVDPAVSDVQINGSSVLNNGVANVPIATTSNLGVIKFNNAYGFGVDGHGNIMVDCADGTLIKAGTNALKPLVPYFQHASTFYGLAKAAGDTTQSQSENAVGTYTDAAKTAIKAMLGVPTMAEIITAVHDSYPAAEEATF